ncbi:GerAB/ArcD/ProY family transporter [Bacillus sp. FSL M8-0052]|uniref:Spore gernimation protein n=1 Tax=Bacillus glycinifermentans TaxID=1664069 RepID=A0AAJ3YWS9_9BACI|nr:MULTISPECIES: GerAB/ArcD/ProY family transporter [Bacillus]MDU0069607.1 GerAB/ArcD/ProY family transporter [Bacillus sp. IG6]MED8017414.1 GerAB/ArcD/ProY family transporter [Bacillus glycinifermentans]QAT64566.1 spore gernimation protein [Bacillus glycinifermentans]WKB78516.1 GerAB/ArcD/ProY family transporter [Bacillus glycinifermentans]
MNPFTLFNKTRPLDGLYMIFITNQMQVLFYILVLPMYLVHPYMIFIMIAIGMLSQLNLVILSKFLKAHPAARGYEGFAELFGERKLRFFVLIGLLQLSVKIMIMVVSYAESVRHFIFPAININWLVLFIILIGGYTASRGMENTMRFVIIAFMSSFWIVFLFIRFYVPPIASLNDLYPLIPFEWTRQSWKALLVTWSAFSSPEYLICLAPWFSKHTKVLKCLTIGNAISLFEYLLLFIASLFFYGSSYLRETLFPVMNMLRYLQSPVLERIDTLLLSAHMFHFAFVIAIFLLCFYGGVSILLKKVSKPVTRKGFYSSILFILAGTLVLSTWFWKTGEQQNIWFLLEVSIGAVTYTLVPSLLVIAGKLKGRME